MKQKLKKIFKTLKIHKQLQQHQKYKKILQVLSLLKEDGFISSYSSFNKETGYNFFVCIPCGVEIILRISRTICIQENYVVDSSRYINVCYRRFSPDNILNILKVELQQRERNFSLEKETIKLLQKVIVHEIPSVEISVSSDQEDRLGADFKIKILDTGVEIPVDITTSKKSQFYKKKENPRNPTLVTSHDLLSTPWVLIEKIRSIVDGFSVLNKNFKKAMLLIHV